MAPKPPRLSHRILFKEDLPHRDWKDVHLDDLADSTIVGLRWKPTTRADQNYRVEKTRRARTPVSARNVRVTIKRKQTREEPVTNQDNTADSTLTELSPKQSSSHLDLRQKNSDARLRQPWVSKLALHNRPFHQPPATKTTSEKRVLTSLFTPLYRKPTFHIDEIVGTSDEPDVLESPPTQDNFFQNSSSPSYQTQTSQLHESVEPPDRSYLDELTSIDEDAELRAAIKEFSARMWRREESQEHLQREESVVDTLGEPTSIDEDAELRAAIKKFSARMWRREESQEPLQREESQEPLQLEESVIHTPDPVRSSHDEPTSIRREAILEAAVGWCSARPWRREESVIDTLDESTMAKEEEARLRAAVKEFSARLQRDQEPLRRAESVDILNRSTPIRDVSTPGDGRKDFAVHFRQAHLSQLAGSYDVPGRFTPVEKATTHGKISTDSTDRMDWVPFFEFGLTHDTPDKFTSISSSSEQDDVTANYIEMSERALSPQPHEPLQASCKSSKFLSARGQAKVETQRRAESSLSVGLERDRLHKHITRSMGEGVTHSRKLTNYLLQATVYSHILGI